MYIYMWTEGQNPHDCDVKPNKLDFEVSLFLAGGYYLLDVFLVKSSFIVRAHHLLSILAILVVLVSGRGASVTNMYGFLVEAPSMFVTLSSVVRVNEVPGKDWLLALYPIVFLMTRFGALPYFTYLIAAKKELPLKLRTCVVLLSFFIVTFLPVAIKSVHWCTCDTVDCDDVRRSTVLSKCCKKKRLRKRRW